MEPNQSTAGPQVVYALGERPAFQVGDRVRVDKRSPVGNYRVPTYLRGKIGIVEAVIEPVALDNEQEGLRTQPRGTPPLLSCFISVKRNLGCVRGRAARR